MKLRYWAIGCMAILYYVVSCQAEPYEIKEDVVECGFPSGGKFILKAEHEAPRSHWGNLLGGHASPRKNQKNFEAWYQDSDGVVLSTEAPSISYSRFRSDPSAESLCLLFGKKSGKPFTAFSFFSEATQKFQYLGWEGRVRPWVNPADSNDVQEKAILERMVDEELTASVTAAIAYGNRVVVETSLVQAGKKCPHESWKSPCPVMAVLSEVSLDNARTWEKPEIKTNSEIFDLGRPLSDQSVIARPTRVNGKSLNPRFPSSTSNIERPVEHK